MKKKLDALAYQYHSILMLKKKRNTPLKKGKALRKTSVIMALAIILFTVIGYLTSNLSDIHYAYLTISTIVVGSYISYRIFYETEYRLVYDQNYKLFHAIFYEVVLFSGYYFQTSSIVLFLHFRLVLSVYLFILILLILIALSIIIYILQSTEYLKDNKIHLFSSVIWSAFVYILIMNILPIKSYTLSVALAIPLLILISKLKILYMSRLKISKNLTIIINIIVLILFLRNLRPYNLIVYNFFAKDNIVERILEEEFNLEDLGENHSIIGAKDTMVFLSRDIIYIVGDYIYSYDYEYQLIEKIDYKLLQTSEELTVIHESEDLSIYILDGELVVEQPLKSANPAKSGEYIVTISGTKLVLNDAEDFENDIRTPILTSLVRGDYHQDVNFFYTINGEHYIGLSKNKESTKVLYILDGEGVVLNKVSYQGLMEINDKAIIISDPEKSLGSITESESIHFYSVNYENPTTIIMPVTTQQANLDIGLFILLAFILRLKLYDFKTITLLNQSDKKSKKIKY